jgi:hypothetical protein
MVWATFGTRRIPRIKGNFHQKDGLSNNFFVDGMSNTNFSVDGRSNTNFSIDVMSNTSLSVDGMSNISLFVVLWPTLLTSEICYTNKSNQDTRSRICQEVGAIARHNNSRYRELEQVDLHFSNAYCQPNPHNVGRATNHMEEWSARAMQHPGEERGVRDERRRRRKSADLQNPQQDRRRSRMPNPTKQQPDLRPAR